MLITPSLSGNNVLSCDFSNQERNAAATLRTLAAAVSERSRRTTADELIQLYNHRQDGGLRLIRSPR
jgi:hypothetical protein